MSSIRMICDKIGIFVVDGVDIESLDTERNVNLQDFLSQDGKNESKEIVALQLEDPVLIEDISQAVENGDVTVLEKIENDDVKRNVSIKIHAKSTEPIDDDLLVTKTHDGKVSYDNDISFLFEHDEEDVDSIAIYLITNDDDNKSTELIIMN